VTPATSALLGSDSSFTPRSLPNLEIWLPTSSATIGGGNLTWLDQSGNHNDGAQPATVWSKVASSSGVPAHLTYPGGASSHINGTLAVGIAAGTPATLCILRSIPVAGNSGKWFDLDFPSHQPLFALDSDAHGTPSRVLGGNFNGSEFVLWDDGATVGWVVDILIQDGAGTGTLYRGTTLKNTAAVSNLPIYAIGAPYTVGGSTLAGALDQARDIAEITLHGIALNSAQRAKMVAYLLGTIAP